MKAREVTILVKIKVLKKIREITLELGQGSQPGVVNRATLTKVSYQGESG